MAKMVLACKAQYEWIFQQDNAKAHVCKKVGNWLSSYCDLKVMQCPTKSHDLSWIENMGVLCRVDYKKTDLSSRKFEAAM
jgi:hypothetical protein